MSKTKMKHRVKKMNFLTQPRTQVEYVESLKGDKYMYEFKPKVEELRPHTDEVFLRTTRRNQRSQYI